MKYNLKYSKELLEIAVKDSLTIAEVLRKLGLAQSGSNHSHIKKRIINAKIDISHFVGSRFNSGERHTKQNKLSPNQIFQNDRLNGRRDKASVLKRALIESGVEEKCEVCGILPEWQGQKLVLQIDHKNGDGCDNRKENLRFLCPNCHSQTDTFGIKNKSNVSMA